MDRPSGVAYMTGVSTGHIRSLEPGKIKQLALLQLCYIFFTLGFDMLTG